MYNKLVKKHCSKVKGVIIQKGVGSNFQTKQYNKK